MPGCLRNASDVVELAGRRRNRPAVGPGVRAGTGGVHLREGQELERAGVRSGQRGPRQLVREGGRFPGRTAAREAEIRNPLQVPSRVRRRARDAPGIASEVRDRRLQHDRRGTDTAADRGFRPAAGPEVQRPLPGDRHPDAGVARCAIAGNPDRLRGAGNAFRDLGAGQRTRRNRDAVPSHHRGGDHGRGGARRHARGESPGARRRGGRRLARQSADLAHTRSDRRRVFRPDHGLVGPGRPERPDPRLRPQRKFRHPRYLRGRGDGAAASRPSQAAAGVRFEFGSVEGGDGGTRTASASSATPTPATPTATTPRPQERSPSGSRAGSPTIPPR